MGFLFVFFIYALLSIHYFIYISDFSFFLSGKKSQCFHTLICFFHVLEHSYFLWIPCISPIIYLLQWLANSFHFLQIIYKYLAASIFPIEKFLHFFLIDWADYFSETAWFINHLYLDICHYSPCKTAIKQLKSRSPVWIDQIHPVNNITTEW